MNKRRVLIILLSAGLLFRLAFLFSFSQTVFFDPSYLDKYDQKTFHIWAQQIQEDPVTGNNEVFYMAPLYPHFLAFLYAISGNSIIFVTLVQIVLDLLTGYFLYLLGKTLFDEPTGFIALAGYMFYRTAVVYAGAILSDSLILFLNISFILSLYSALKKKRWHVWIGSGIILGFAALAKPTILAFFPFFLIGLSLYPDPVITPFASTRRIHHLFFATLASLAGAAIIILPVTLRNFFIGGTFVPICTNGPINWIISNSADSTGLFMYPKERLLSVLEPQFWHLQLTKTLFFFNSYEWPQNLDVQLLDRLLPVLKAGFVRFGLVVPLGIVGLVVAARSKKRFLFLSFTLIQILWVVLFFVTDRFRLPAIACFMLFAAYTIRIIFLDIKEKKIARGAAILLAAGLWAFFFNPPPGALIPETQYRIYASLTKKVVAMELQSSKLRLAEKQSRDYLYLLPSDPDSHFLLACVLHEKGDIPGALRSLQETLRIDPNHRLAQEYFSTLSSPL
ncbi:MAG: glycosyltransferase family 39 protein [Candidatus Ratteibacteria bacterium]